KHRYMTAHLTRRRTGGVPDEAEAFLRDLSERVRRVQEILGSHETSSFVMVTIPEAMAVEETIRYVRTARAEGAPITELIINRVEVLHGSCKYCRARHASQRPHLARLKAEFQDLRQRRVPLLSSEVRGMDGLLAFGRMVWIASNPDHP